MKNHAHNTLSKYEDVTKALLSSIGHFKNFK